MLQSNPITMPIATIYFFIAIASCMYEPAFVPNFVAAV